MKNSAELSVWLVLIMGLLLLLGAVFFAAIPQYGGLLAGIAGAVGLGTILLGWGIQKNLKQLSHKVERSVEKALALESEILQQRQVVDSLADGMDQAIFLCDAKANVLYANKNASELFDFENPVHRQLLAVTLSSQLEGIALRAATTQTPQEAELSLNYPQERLGLARAWVQLPKKDRVFVSILDITRLRRLERVRQDFVANVSHELRTPMSVIRAMAETLLEEGEDGELRERYLNKVIAEVDRLTQISSDLLILSTAESGPVHKSSCDLTAVIREVSQQLGEKAKSKGLALSYEGPKDLILQANEAQLSQVVINLIDNAINYTQEGSIKVGLVQDGDQVILRVQDTGIGIPSEHLPRIFERFYRVDKARSRATGGTGLGLSIVRHIVEAHGGKVSVESDFNKGSTFIVVLPRGEDESQPAESVS